MITDIKTIFHELVAEITSNEVDKSSHWAKHTKDTKIDIKNLSISNISGFGGRQKNNFITRGLHSIFQAIYFSKPNHFKKSPYYKHAKEISNLQNKVIDIDALRHILTFDFLQEVLNKKLFFHDQNIKTNCCIIGDGQTNFLSLALLSNHFNKIISINLPEVLLNDLDLIKCLTRSISINMCLVRDSAELSKALKDPQINIILITSKNSPIVKNKDIRLFINIASMQEMDRENICKYFDIIKSNHAYFYCCNREEKKLSDEYTSSFYNYPWGNCEILSEGRPWWHQYYYSIFPPMKRPYDGTILHQVVKYGCASGKQ